MSRLLTVVKVYYERGNNLPDRYFISSLVTFSDFYFAFLVELINKSLINMCRAMRKAGFGTHADSNDQDQPEMLCIDIFYSFQVLKANGEGPDQTARMRSLIWAFAGLKTRDIPGTGPMQFV